MRGGRGAHHEPDVDVNRGSNRGGTYHDATCDHGGAAYDNDRGSDYDKPADNHDHNYHNHDNHDDAAATASVRRLDQAEERAG